MKNNLCLFLFCVSGSVSATFGQVNVNNGLIAYYPFNGNANDASGNRNSAIFNNAMLTADRFGNSNGAYYFNGINNYIQIPNSPSPNPSQVSLAANVEPLGFYYGACHGNAILKKGDNNNILASYRIRYDDYLYTNGQNCANPVSDSVQQNFYSDFAGNGINNQPYAPYASKQACYCLVYTYDGATANFYVDGLLVSSRIPGNTYVTNASDLYLGNLNLTFFPYWFNGVLDETRIYDRPLNVQEVNALCPLCSVQGSFTGDTICAGTEAELTFTASSGSPPFSIVYSDGLNTYTQNNVQSGVPFDLTLNPVLTSKYYILSVTDAAGCSSPGPFTDDTATVLITNCSFCDGSLGDPVINITFDSGVNPGAPLSSVVPGASTTLTYVPVTGNPATPTLEDGQYTITTNVPSRALDPWFSGAPDHTSGNGTGFMAFYNSSVQPGEFYKQTVTDLCGSTTYEFAAWIANALNPANINGQDPNITFSIEQMDGTILGIYTTGNILESSSFTWNKYGFYFTTPPSLSTVVLRMSNSNTDAGTVGGNDFAIDDITFRACGPTTSASFDQNSIVDTLKICSGAGAKLFGTVSGGYTNPNYLWQLSVDTGMTWTDIPNSNTLEVPVSTAPGATAGFLMYRMMTANGSNINSPNCRVASNLLVLELAPGPLGSLAGETICAGDNGLLSFSASSGLQPFTITYQAGANQYIQSNLSGLASFPVPYSLTDTTVFTLTAVQDASGCTTSLNQATSINVNPIPQGQITASPACSGDSVAIVFNGNGSSPFEIQLTDGSSTTAYYGIQSGEAFHLPPATSNETLSLVSITDQNGKGCTRTSGFSGGAAAITILKSPQIRFDSIPPVCINAPPFVITEAMETTGMSGLGLFSGEGVDASGDVSPGNTGSGTYLIWYSFAAADGCADSASRYLVINSLPAVNAGPDVTTCIGFPIRLSATGAFAYLWSPTAGLSDSAAASPLATVDNTTTFIVRGTDSNGCVAEDTVVVSVSTHGVSSFQVANAFTPNGDGLNDCFGIRNWGADVTVEEFSIFNRWGQLVFSTKNPSDCWDGTFKGVKQDPGGYPYIIRAISPCGRITRTGIVLLIR